MPRPRTPVLAILGLTVAATIPSAAPARSPTWVASAAGAWRLPTRGYGIAILDRKTAVIGLPKPGRDVMAVDLETGAITRPTPIVPVGSEIHDLGRVGERVFAFGRDDDGPAAWQLAGSPLRATAIQVAPGRPGTPAKSAPEIVAAPDGDRFVWCDKLGPPTLRDARTFAILRQLDAPSCAQPRFTSRDTVVLGDDEVDLATGTRRAASKAIVHAGPKGRILTVTGYPLSEGEVTGRDKVVLQQKFSLGDELRWTPDGTAISAGGHTMTIRPAADGSLRTATTKLHATVLAHVDVSATYGVILNASTVEVVDLKTGKTKTATGNLELVGAVEPRGGEVVSTSDALRVWRDGQEVASEVADVTALQAWTAPQVAMLDRDGVAWLFDPGTAQRRKLGTAHRSVLYDLLAVAAGEAWVPGDRSIVRLAPGKPQRTWLRFRAGLTPVALDPPHRAAWLEDELLHVADLDQKQAWTMKLDDSCSVMPQPMLVPGRRMIAMREGRRLELIDLDRGTTAAIAIPQIGAIDVTQTGELLVAHEGELVMWRPDEAVQQVWSTGIAAGAVPSSVRADDAGLEVAIGYSTGGIVWAELAHVRAKASSRPAPARQKSCVMTPKPTTFAALGLIVERP